MQPLPKNIIDRIFARLHGIYGNTFSQKFSTGLDASGIDTGLENAKMVWSETLAGFANDLEAIKFGLAHVDAKFPPSALEFRDLCRRAPAKDAPALPYRPTADDHKRAQAAIAKAAQAVRLKPKSHAGFDRHWASHPRSEMHLKLIFDAANNDARFSPCIAEMIQNRICSAEGRLLKCYQNGVFVDVKQQSAPV